jgi:hypothetical protein
MLVKIFLNFLLKTDLALPLILLIIFLGAYLEDKFFPRYTIESSSNSASRGTIASM